MNRLARIARGTGNLVLGSYLFVAFLMVPYYNWQYAKDHGFVAWFVFGQFTPTAMALAWPYFVFLGDHQPSRIAATSSRGEPRSFKCTQPLPEFTLGPTSNPSDVEVEKLCACIWSKLPEGGWERAVSTQIRNGEDPGWRGRGFVPRFGGALDACGGGSL